MKVLNDFAGSERFTIQRRLGSGSFGVVYEAFDHEQNSVVALKTLVHADANALYRFKREFRALADVSHPNLVALYELLSDGQRWFFTMEFVDGVNFLDYVWGEGGGHRMEPRFSSASTSTLPYGDSCSAPDDAGRTFETTPQTSELSCQTNRTPLRLDIERLRVALKQLAAGVTALHRGRHLHRDLKPSNVLVDRKGRVVVLDFGLVADLVTDPPAAETADVVGTPIYMSPEQAVGSPLSESSDWYSFGVMLYEALTGYAPFRGPFLQVVKSKQTMEPPSPDRLALGIPEDLSCLCRDLLRRDSRLRPSGQEVLRRLEGIPLELTRAPVSPPKRTMPRLVGRESHLRALMEAYQTCKAGGAVAVFLHGSSGMGKTALVQWFLAELYRCEDVVILQGRCYERESVPYKALDSVVDALSQHLKRLPSLQVEAVLPRDILALSRLFPVLRQVEAVATVRRRILATPDSQELRRRAFAALRDLLARLAEQKPIVIFIDDLQWGDVDSASLLAEILLPPDPPPLLLITGYRSEEAASSPVLERLLAMVPTGTASVDAREIVLRELSPNEARDLALSLLGNQSDTAQVWAKTIARESRGNPFFIHELAQFLLANLGECEPSEIARSRVAFSGVNEITLEKVIQTRVLQLPEKERRLLEVVAVAGQPLRIGVARSAASLETHDFGPVLTLRSEHLIRIRGSGSQGDIETYHDRIRETVVANLAPDGLRGHHRRLAFALEASGRADPETLAVHFQGAGDGERAAEYATTAADQAMQALAFERAARLYRFLLDLNVASEIEAQKLRVRLADALANGGRAPEAAAAYLRASEEARAAEKVELQRRAAEQFLRCGHIDEGIQALRTVLVTLGMKLAATPRRALVSLLFRRAYIRLRGLRFRERDESQVSAEELIRVDTCWSAAMGLGIVDNIRGADFHERHLLLALRTGEPYRISRALALEVGYSATGGSHSQRRTQELIHATQKLAERINHPHALGLAVLTAGIAAYLEGRWRDGVVLTDRAATMLRDRCTGVGWELANAEIFRFLSLYYLGELGELARRLPAVCKDAEQRGDLFAATSLRSRISFIAELAADNPEEARIAVDEAIEQWSRQGFHIQHLWAMVGKMEIALYSGAVREAWNIITRSWPDLARSQLLRIQQPLVGCLHHRARCALALAALVECDRPYQNELLRSAERDARRMERERTLYGNGMAGLIRAGIAATRGDMKLAAGLAGSAERALQAVHMGLYAAAARRRRGELLGGDEGRAQMQSADAWLSAQGVKNIRRMIDMLAPGKWLVA
jgi:serine/threonine protein kinase